MQLIVKNTQLRGNDRPTPTIVISSSEAEVERSSSNFNTNRMSQFICTSAFPLSALYPTAVPLTQSLRTCFWLYKSPLIVARIALQWRIPPTAIPTGDLNGTGKGGGGGGRERAENNYLITKDFDLTVAPMVDLGIPRIFERVNLQMQRQALE